MASKLWADLGECQVERKVDGVMEYGQLGGNGVMGN